MREDYQKGYYLTNKERLMVERRKKRMQVVLDHRIEMLNKIKKDGKEV